jgi:thymidylate synthase (FAD)
MNYQEISVHCIARTSIDATAVYEWLEKIGASSFELPDDIATDAELVVGVAAKRCYKSFEPGLNPNVTKVREDWAEYLDNILKSGHGSVIEHASWTWAIENCTRVFTAEMNRHRAGVAISEGSLRYIRFQDGPIPFWLPLS